MLESKEQAVDTQSPPAHYLVNPVGSSTAVTNPTAQAFKGGFIRSTHWYAILIH